MGKVQKSVLVMVLVAVFVYNHYVYNPAVGAHPAMRELNDLQKQSVSLLLEMTKLLFSLSSALFGVIGFFLFKLDGNGAGLSRKSIRNAILAFSFAALSIDFGYVFMEKWVELLANGMFAPFEFIVLCPQTLQFSTFLLALFFSASLALTELETTNKQEGGCK